MTDDKAVIQVLLVAASARCGKIIDQIKCNFGLKVLSGPFTDLLLPEIRTWGDGHLLPKMLGSYEAELHGKVEEMIFRHPALVVNVGCAEGYYATGLARRLPGIPVHAFDSDEKAQVVCRESAVLNKVDHQVTVRGLCSADDLCSLTDGQRALVVMDCEGGEADLLSPRTAPALAASDILVECHDFMQPNVTEAIVAAFQNSHDIVLLREGGRDPAAYPFLRGIGSLDRWLAVCEFRPCVMHWLAMTPKKQQGAAL